MKSRELRGGRTRGVSCLETGSDIIPVFMLSGWPVGNT